MLDDTERKEIGVLIEQSNIILGISIGVLLLMNLPIGSGGPLGLFSATIGIGVGGWSITRPQATPLSLIPRAPGFSQEITQEQQFLENIKPKLTAIRQTHLAKIRFITGCEIGLLSLGFFISLVFMPAWPANGDLVLGGILLLISFLFGAGIAIATCWISIYKTLLRTMT